MLCQHHKQDYTHIPNRLVLDEIHQFQKINQIKLNYEIAPRRDGDVAICYADATRANNLLNWKTEKNISEMCQDAWDTAVRFESV